MFDTFFTYFIYFEDILWGYFGVPIIVALGLFLSISSNFFQIRHFPVAVKTFVRCLVTKHCDTKGVHPLKAFFACVGGCVGVGNVVGICTAVQVGGPGALFWIWVTAILGSVVKYAEVYLGVKYRVRDGGGNYSGGPMYFLQKLTQKKWLPILVCLLLCVYGVEVYQFSVITESLIGNFDLDRNTVVVTMLILIAFAGSGGVKRLGNISSTIIPIFVVAYMGMGFWVLFNNLDGLAGLFKQVFTNAFSQTSVAGGLLGSSLMLTISQGVRRGCYSADVGVGYASIIHSESGMDSPEQQASLVILDVFLDTFLICTMSVMLILVSGSWSEPMEAGLLVQKALAKYFPFVDFFMPLFLLILGYSTITAYFCAGVKSAEFLSKKWGKPFFYFYALMALAISAFVDTAQAQAVMAISGGLLLVINCCAIFFLRHELNFSMPETVEAEPVVA